MGKKVSKQKRQLLTIVGLCVLLLALVISFFVITRYKDKTEKEAETNISLYTIKDADIIMFELLNEVVSFDVVDEWNDLSSRAVKIIRETAR